MAKIKKKMANYRRATTSHNCHNCKHMLNDGHCELVKGLVDPQFVCDLWQAE